jgi:hypothetical protein
MVRKPEGIAETESLLRTLAQVPKHELDARLAKNKKPKKRAKRRKK